MKLCINSILAEVYSNERSSLIEQLKIFWTAYILIMYRVGQKRGTLLLSISSLDRFSKFFHWHTLRTICNNVSIRLISHQTVNASLQFYTTLWNNWRRYGQK